MDFEELLLLWLPIRLLYTTAPSTACAPRISYYKSGPQNYGVMNGEHDEVGIDNVSHSKKIEWSTTSDWFMKHNYSYEEHTVTTVDGYRLLMQRLPREGARPILLVHGLLTSSLAWVLLGPNKSLAFQLYNSHYDVWLANLRGAVLPVELITTTMSTVPTSSSAKAVFWNYSFHEQGEYDLPAFIDYIRERSSFQQIVLITHSQAFNAFLVLCSMHPIYNERILFTQALAPTMRLRKYMKLSASDVRRIMKFVKSKRDSQSEELFPAGNLKKTCLIGNSKARATCQKYLQLIIGQGEYQKSLESLVFGQLLRGGSVKEITHLQQIWKSGDFIAFDYGPVDNLKRFNSIESLRYNLSQVTVPTVLYFGSSDAFATPEGVHSIYAKTQIRSVVGVYRINTIKFSHFDFICNSEIRTLVNEKLIEVMESFIEGKLPYVIE